MKPQRKPTTKRATVQGKSGANPALPAQLSAAQSDATPKPLFSYKKMRRRVVSFV
jgi:hypothetical protein